MSSIIYRATIVVIGRVQGVGFRYWTVAEVHALRLPVTGTVRNQADGSVEVVAESADRSAIEQLLARLATGPGLARVDAVHPIYESSVERRYTDFKVSF
ncbi:MAG: acylphosphatase [Akkermansiaceae bacterium]|nr:acylphosphatase [Armatimonadota bacterium]